MGLSSGRRRSRGDGEFTFTEVAHDQAARDGARKERSAEARAARAQRRSPGTARSSTSTRRSAAPAKVVDAAGAARAAAAARTLGAVPVVIGTAFPFSDPQAALAAKYFIEGSRLDDGDESKTEEAAAAYRKALVIDPDLVPAIVNLANIHYGRDELIEAQALYERAIALDQDCFEAHFNLGNIHHDLGRYDDALVCYRDAVALSPGYADAHFYLAVTLEKTGHSPEAKPHWKTYQELAPEGEWIELAREFSE